MVTMKPSMVSTLKKGDHPVFSVGVDFTIDHTLEPSYGVIHEALEALRAFDIEAPTSEVAEHYADVIMRALTEDGS